MNEQVEWLKAQVEAFLADTPLVESARVLGPIMLEEFVAYVEKKFTPRGLLDR